MKKPITYRTLNAEAQSIMITEQGFDLPIFPLNQFSTPFYRKLPFSEPVAVRRSTFQRKPSFSSSKTKPQSLNHAQISKRNQFQPILSSFQVLGMELTAAL